MSKVREKSFSETLDEQIFSRTEAVTERLQGAISSVGTLEPFANEAKSEPVGKQGNERFKSFQTGMFEIKSAISTGLREGVHNAFSNASVNVHSSIDIPDKKLAADLAAISAQSFAANFARALNTPESREVQEYLRKQNEERNNAARLEREENKAKRGTFSARLDKAFAKAAERQKYFKPYSSQKPVRTNFKTEAAKMRRWARNASMAAVMNSQLMAQAATQKIASIGKFFSKASKGIATGATKAAKSLSVSRALKVGSLVAAGAAIISIAPHMVDALPHAAHVAGSLANDPNVLATGQHAHAAAIASHDAMQQHAAMASKAIAKSSHSLATSGMGGLMTSGHQHLHTASHVVHKAAQLHQTAAQHAISVVSADDLNARELQALNHNAHALNALHDPRPAIHEHLQTLAPQSPANIQSGVSPSNPLAKEVYQHLKAGPDAKLHVPLTNQIGNAAKSTLIDQPVSYAKGVAAGVRDMFNSISGQHAPQPIAMEVTGPQYHYDISHT